MTKRMSKKAKQLAMMAAMALRADALASEFRALGFKVNVVLTTGNTYFKGQAYSIVEAVKPGANGLKVVELDGQFSSMWSLGFQGGDCVNLVDAGHARSFARTLPASW